MQDTKPLQTFVTLQALNLKVGRAWAIKEALRTLWTYQRLPAVRRFFARSYGWAVRSRLEPVKNVAATLKRHLDGVLGFVKHPITNGVAEGLNSGIMSIKRKAGGFRSPSNFTTAVFFHCGPRPKPTLVPHGPRKWTILGLCTAQKAP